MGDKITLKIDAREVQGKKVATLRAQGLTPGVVYGPGIEPYPVQADAGEVRKVVARAGKHSPVNLTGAKRRIAMIKSVDYDPTKHGAIRHVSFHAVNADEPVSAEVPIHLTGQGESQAEKAGLIVLQAIDRIEIKALPADLPEALEISIADLVEVGERLTLGDVTLPKGVELADHGDQQNDADDEESDKPSMLDLVIASVYEPSALQAANEAAAGDAEDESSVEAENGAEEAAVNDSEEKSEKSE